MTRLGVSVAAGIMVIAASCSSRGATVHAVATTTSTSRIPPPTTATVPATTLPPVTAKAAVLASRVESGSIFGTIDAGPGGTGTATLRDDHGHTWHREADPSGAYRFDGLAPGHYELTLSASSAAPACSPGSACLGPASRATRQDIRLAAGENHRADLRS